MKKIYQKRKTIYPLSIMTLSALLTGAFLAIPALAQSADAAATVQRNAITVPAIPPGDVFAINAGGIAAGGYSADTDFLLGSVYSNNSQQVSTLNVPNAAPSAVYQDVREGDHFSYVFSGLKPATTYAIILHFAELYWTYPEQRQFNVSINGKQVLTNFDIVQTVGGPFEAVVESFFIASDPSGKIEIDFLHGAVDQPMVNAVEIRSDSN